uniref:Uncharacterized protein n=1 Tax=Glossina pallidipes TaxID=7398 RepID=A0A1A9Z7V5_GLOPL
MISYYMELLTTSRQTSFLIIRVISSLREIFHSLSERTLFPLALLTPIHMNGRHGQDRPKETISQLIESSAVFVAFHLINIERSPENSFSYIPNKGSVQVNRILEKNNAKIAALKYYKKHKRKSKEIGSERNSCTVQILRYSTLTASHHIHNYTVKYMLEDLKMAHEH